MKDPMKQKRNKLLSWLHGFPICGHCSIEVKLPERITVDHIKPQAKGGRDNLGNLVLSCAACNSQKQDDENWPSPRFRAWACLPLELRTQLTQREESQAVARAHYQRGLTRHRKDQLGMFTMGEAWPKKWGA